MTKTDLRKQLEKAHKFIFKHEFEMQMLDPSHSLSVCNNCKERAWLPEDVKHEENCEIGDVLRGQGGGKTNQRRTVQARQRIHRQRMGTYG